MKTVSSDMKGSSDEESEELLPLTHYAGDEDKLVDLMFAAIQDTKLEAMMPPVLQVCSCFICSSLVTGA